ncbi:ABC transporter substrate-binding protein [Neptunomonas phycophila]|uniref:ABC transporter substrate-binding protein n=1 Tax=Neptunomonas phycophila TaxID=1572645 RepID=UPI0009488DE0|nr:iron-siderophore ABC transporter substrate-binding protein [Neptunomonas phycophila]
MLPVSRLIRSVSIVALTASALLSVSLVHADDERTLSTKFGDVTLSGDPQRVVVLEDEALDTALALGLKPVATLATRGGSGVPAYLQERVGDIKIVGSIREPNLEAVFAVKPDLIIASSNLDKSLYEKLSMMAPTVVPEIAVGTPWKESVAFFGKALNREEQTQQRLDAITQRMAELKGKLPENTVLSVVRWNPQGPIVMSDKLFAGQILAEVGLKSPAIAGELEGRPHSDILSLENLSQVDGDWLFLATLNSDGQAALETAKEQPAFKRLQAVVNGKAVAVDGQIWSSGSGMIAADSVLDTLAEHLVP